MTRMLESLLARKIWMAFWLEEHLSRARPLPRSAHMEPKLLPKFWHECANSSPESMHDCLLETLSVSTETGEVPGQTHRMPYRLCQQ